MKLKNKDIDKLIDKTLMGIKYANSPKNIETILLRKLDCNKEIPLVMNRFGGRYQNVTMNKVLVYIALLIKKIEKLENQLEKIPERSHPELAKTKCVKCHEILIAKCITPLCFTCQKKQSLEEEELWNN